MAYSRTEYPHTSADEEPRREVLDRLVAAVGRYERAQRRRDSAYAELLDVLREAAWGPAFPSSLLARICGFSVTRIRQIVNGPVSKRDADRSGSSPPSQPQSG